MQRHHIIRFLAIAVAYFLAGKAAFLLPYHDTTQWLIWLPTGIALASLIIWGWRYAPAVFCGSMLLTLASDFSLFTAILFATSTTVSTAIPAALITRLCGTSPLSSLRGLIMFLLIGALGAPLISATVGSGVALITGVTDVQNLRTVWEGWVLSGTVGTLVGTPLILRLFNQPWKNRHLGYYLELAFISCAAVIVSSIIQITPIMSRPEFLFIFVSLPFVIWAAVRFGLLGATLINALIMINIIIFTSFGTGGFVSRNFNTGPGETYNYIIAVTFVTILLAVGLEKMASVTTRARDGKISHDIHRLRRNLAVIVAVLGFGISAVAGWYTYVQLTEADSAQTEQYRRAFEASLREELGRATDSLVAVRTLFDVHGNVSFNTFDAMIAPWVSRRPGISALEWAPFVEGRARNLVEENAHLRGVADFEIRHLQDGKLTRSPLRDDGYFPIFYVFPRSGNEQAIGFDLASDPVRKRALETTLRTGNITLTEPLDLFRSDSAVVTSLALLGVQNRRDKGGPPLGVAIGVLRLTNMITRAARVARLPSNYELHLADFDADDGKQVIYSNRKADYTVKHLADERAIQFNPNISNFTFGYRDWTIDLHQENAHYAGLLYWQPWAIFIFGATVSILLMIYLRSLTRTERQIVDLVSLRTRELEDAREEAESAMNQAQQADKAKSEFIAHMSHEFRSPMTSILGYTQLASDSLGNDPAQETLRGYLSTIRGAGRHVLSLIGDILDISKIEAGKLILEEVPFDLHRVCEEVSSMMLVPARAQKNKLHLNVAPDMPRWVVGDPVRLKQVLTNFVSNAVKFTKFGNITIDVSPLTVTDDTLSMRIAVRDDGIGIAQNKLDSIFEAFAQADTSTTRRYGGTGLGLAICQKIIQAMGGAITVESKEGDGSTFWFDLTLPRSTEGAASENTDAQNVENAFAEEPRARGWNLLLVEDIEINRILAQKLLELQGHTVTTAADGQIALDILAAEDFDAVLMDVHMPVLDGIEATRFVRQLEDPVKATIPVLALTADISNDNLAVFREAGFDAHCTKPLDIKTINSELSRLEHRMLEERRALQKKAGE